MDDFPEFVFSPWQRRQGIAERIERLLRYPIHRARWYRHGHAERFINALHERYPTPNRPLRLLIRPIAHTAILLAFKRHLPPITFEGTDIESRSLERWTHQLRRLVNTEATEDLLGPDWRLHPPTIQAPITSLAEHDAWERIEPLLNDPRTTPAERKLIHTFIETQGDYSHMADRLQRTPNAIKQAFYRLRKKHAG
jgi:hypothetical protein